MRPFSTLAPAAVIALLLPHVTKPDGAWSILATASAAQRPGSTPVSEVIREVSNQKLEEILKSLSIQYTTGGDNKGTTWFDYTSKNQQLRLTNFSGKDLMIDVFLAKVDWETINKWNGTAKFSRARLNKDNKGTENAVIESNLDLVGGVTEDTIKHFIRSFDNEVAVWMKDAGKNPMGKDPAGKDPPGKDPAPKNPASNVLEEETFKVVAADKLEKVFNSLNIQFKKTQGQGTNVFYDFERNNFKIRLTNFGGQDLMIDCVYPQAPLTKINEWNVKRSYVRVVLYPGNGMPYTALESNLDCAAGVSENIIRYFITSFDGEVTAFDKHLKGS